MSTKKEIERLVLDAVKWGWRVELTKKGWMVYPADIRFPPITVHRTDSDHRALQNYIARFRRAGAPLKRK